MRALVTGGTGFIGLAVGRALAADGAEVTLADVRPREELVDFPAKVRAADLGSWAEILHVTADTRPEVIVHAGALLSATGEAMPLRAFEANGAGTLHVLEAAVLLGVGQVLLMSSIASYGPGVPDGERDAHQRDQKSRSAPAAPPAPERAGHARGTATASGRSRRCRHLPRRPQPDSPRPDALHRAER